jgi:hypothetical protein
MRYNATWRCDKYVINHSAFEQSSVYTVCYKRVLQALRGCRTPLIEQKFPLSVVQKPVRAEIWVMFMWSLQQMLHVVPMHFNTTFSSSLYGGAYSVEFSRFHSNLQTGIVISLLLYSYIGAKCIKVFRCRHSQEFSGLKSGDRAGQLAVPARAVSTGSGADWQCREKESVPDHAWTTHVVADEEAHPPE